MNPKKTPTQSTKEFFEAKAAEKVSPKLKAGSTETDQATDVEATLHEVLDESMESAASVDAMMMCLMAVVKQGLSGVQADPYLPPSEELLE